MTGVHCLLEDSRHKNLHPDQDQDNAAEDRRFSGKPRADLSAQPDTGKADAKRDDTDDQRFCQGGNQVIFRNGKANGKGVNGSRDSLDKKRAADMARVLDKDAHILEKL